MPTGALRPALLRQRVARERQRLEGARLNPLLLTRPLRQAQERLDRVGRLLQSLDPKRLLDKGYALVLADGQVVTSAADARAAGAVTLVFHDGETGAITGDAAPAPEKNASPLRDAPVVAKPRRQGDVGEIRQQDLFS